MSYYQFDYVNKKDAHHFQNSVEFDNYFSSSKVDILMCNCDSIFFFKKKI